MLGMQLVLTQLLWHTRAVRGENARKLFHIMSCSFAAFWPMYLSWPQIQIVGMAMAFCILIIRGLKLFPGLYEVKRRSWGELFIVVMVLIAAFIEPSRVVFAAAALHVALPDGLAAIMGVRYGRKNQYKVFGYTKSLAGTATFFVTSLVIMIGIYMLGDISPTAPLAAIIVIPVVTTLIENLAVWGVDNALIATTVVILFSMFRIV